MWEAVKSPTFLAPLIVADCIAAGIGALVPANLSGAAVAGLAVLTMTALVFLFTFLGAVVRAPFVQRNDARAALARLEGERTAELRGQSELKLVEDELAVAWTEAEIFFVTDPVDIAAMTEHWRDWRHKTAEFIGVALGHAPKAAFKGVGVELESLSAFVQRDRAQLIEMAERLSLGRVRADLATLERAKDARRKNEAIAVVRSIHAAEQNRRKRTEGNAQPSLRRSSIKHDPLSPPSHSH